MLNIKKIEVCYKSYKNKFRIWFPIEDIDECYTKDKYEVLNIIKENDISREHVLLLNLDSAFSLYLFKWKNTVLINDYTRPEGLKEMQMIIFYQCVIHDLFKEKCSNIRPRHTFELLVKCLIHLTIFGWKREEEILFSLIEENFKGYFIDINERKKHVWFLLELYLQYRNKTLLGTNKNLYKIVKKNFLEEGLQCDLIDSNLDIYDEILRKWDISENEKVNDIFYKMILFHSKHASDMSGISEFNDFVYRFYPIEILFLIYIRKKLGLFIPDKFDSLLMNYSESKMIFKDPESYPEWDPILILIDGYFKKNYSEYISNKYENLFK